MTTADRANARRRSLFDWGVLHPNGRHPSPLVSTRRVANLSQPSTDASQREYSTYAPKGAKCRKCGKPFRTLETVTRVAVERASGGSSADQYEHHACGGHV